MRDGATRRGFLALGVAGAVGAAGEARAATGRAEGSPRGEVVPFHGSHQAGITTRSQEFVHFLALDVIAGTAAGLAGLMRRLSAAAGRLSRGRPVGPLATGERAPLDTGEAVGLPPARLTITFGFGPPLFSTRRFGLDGLRPAPLVELPSFANESLDPAICGGDIGIQVCAEDPQVAFHAVHNLIRMAHPDAIPRWSLAGFGRTLNTRGGPTPRNLLGFKEGTGNIRAGEPDVERFVWAGAPESPEWMTGGTYMVVRRIQILLANWDSIGLQQQEQTFGRHKLSGAPLGRRHEDDPLDLDAAARGRPLIPPFAHVRLASPAYNDGQRLLRRGYSYVAPATDAGRPAAGQLFICFQRDPRKQFIPIQQRLALSDLLNEHIEHVGSAIFACPPGAPVGTYVGEGLLA